MAREPGSALSDRPAHDYTSGPFTQNSGSFGDCRADCVSAPNGTHLIKESAVQRLIFAFLAAATVVSASPVRAQEAEADNGLPLITIMHGGVNQLDKDLDFLLKLAGPKAAAQLPLIASIIPAFTDGIDLTRPITVDIILEDPRDYRISLPINDLKALLKNIGGFAGVKARQVAKNKWVFKDGPAFSGVAIWIDINKNGRPDKGDYLVLAQDPKNIPANFTPLKAIERLKKYHLAASVTNTAAGAAGRKKAMATIREELEAVNRPLPNETDDQYELRKLAQNHRMDELERLFVDAEELVLGWTTDYVENEGRLELELSALPETQLARDIAAMGEDPSLFSAIVRADDATVFGNLNHRLDAMRQGNIKQFLGLIEQQALKRIAESGDLDDNTRPFAAQALSGLIAMLQEGNSELERIDGFLSITEDKNGRTMSGGIRAPCGTDIDNVLRSLQKAGWDVELAADTIGTEPPIIGDPPAAENAAAEEDDEQEAAEDGCPKTDVVTIHKVKIPVSREFDFAAVFGSSTMLVAAGSHVVYYAVGPDAAEDIQKAVELTGEQPQKEDGTFFEVWYRIGPWIRWAQQRAARLGPDPDLSEDEKKAQEELEALGVRALAIFGQKDAIYTKLQVEKQDDQKMVLGVSRFEEDLLKLVGSEIAEWARKTLN